MSAMLALMNSHYSQYCLDLISPTINYEVGHVSSIPINDNITVEGNVKIRRLRIIYH